jgi:hypothetical protein
LETVAAAQTLRRTRNAGRLSAFGIHAMIRSIFLLSAFYLAAIGLALMAFPRQFGAGAVPADAAPELIALLRLLGGPFLGIAVLDWLSRDARPSATVRAILLANIVGFGAVAANDMWGVATGHARDLAKLFLIVHLAFTFAFIAAARAVWRMRG